MRLFLLILVLLAGCEDVHREDTQTRKVVERVIECKKPRTWEEMKLPKCIVEKAGDKILEVTPHNAVLCTGDDHLMYWYADMRAGGLVQCHCDY